MPAPDSIQVSSTDDVNLTPQELHRAHRRLFGSEKKTASFFKVKSERTVRGWWNGERNGKEATAPGPVHVLTRALLESEAVRDYFGINLAHD